MKTLIYQINIGKGTNWLGDQVSDLLNKYFIPSVKNYAKRYNYDYRVFKEDIFVNYGKNFLLTKGTALSFNKWLYLKYLDYDQIAYIDTDVYVSKNAEKLPIVKNFNCVAEPDQMETHNLYRNYYSLEKNFKYINAGVFICDRNSGQYISEYMIERIRKKKKGRPKNTCNGILNEFLYLNDKNYKFNLLNKKWNHLYLYSNKKDVIKANFTHICGGDGKQFLIDLEKKNINIIKFFEENF